MEKNILIFSRLPKIIMANGVLQQYSQVLQTLIIQMVQLVLMQQENVLRLVDPKNVLKRGYSITTVNGKTIQADTHLTAGDIIQTKTLDFEIESIIQNIQTHE